MSRVAEFRRQLSKLSPPTFGIWFKIDLHNHSPSSFDYHQSILDDFTQDTPLFMAYAEFQNFLQPFEEDDLLISFDVGKSGERFSPIDQMSAGQRFTAIFPLLLEIGSGPLIMDQPEDNLDNRHIAASTSDSLIDCKPTRQVAFTSHNANLVVLTDAEHIVAFEAAGSNGVVVDRGFFAHPASSIGRHVIEILDGGEKALEMRNRKYKNASFLNKDIVA